MHLRRQVWDYANEHGGLILDVDHYKVAFPRGISVPIAVLVLPTPPIDLDLTTITAASNIVGCPRKSLYDAIERKYIPTYEVKWSPIRHVKLSEVRTWNQHRRKLAKLEMSQ